MIAGAPTDIRTARGRASNLTHVELTWLEKRIEHWIRFGRIAEERVLTRRTRIVSFAPGASSRSSAGPRTTSARSSRASTSCAQSLRASPIPPCPSSAPAAKSCSASSAGRTSAASCTRSIRSRRSASIQPTRRRTTGVMSTTGWSPVSSRGRTRARGTTPGSSARAAPGEPPSKRARRCGPRCFSGRRSAFPSALTGVERERERPHRPLRRRTAD